MLWKLSSKALKKFATDMHLQKAGLDDYTL